MIVMKIPSIIDADIHPAPDRPGCAHRGAGPDGCPVLRGHGLRHPRAFRSSRRQHPGQALPRRPERPRLGRAHLQQPDPHREAAALRGDRARAVHAGSPRSRPMASCSRGRGPMPGRWSRSCTPISSSGSSAPPGSTQGGDTRGRPRRHARRPRGLGAGGGARAGARDAARAWAAGGA